MVVVMPGRVHRLGMQPMMSSSILKYGNMIHDGDICGAWRTMTTAPRRSFSSWMQHRRRNGTPLTVTRGTAYDGNNGGKGNSSSVRDMFWNEIENTDSNGGGGIGDGGNGDGGDGNDFSDDDGNFSGNVWMLALAAATMLGIFGIYQQRKKSTNSKEYEKYVGAIDTDDVRTLKRLLREVFADLLKVHNRLGDLETVAGISPIEDDTDASVLSIGGNDAAKVPSAHLSRDASGSPGIMRTTPVHGRLEIGGGLLWDEGSPPNGGSWLQSMQDAGVRLGTDMMLRLYKTVRGGNDRVAVDIKIDPGAEDFSLQRALYTSEIASGLRVAMAPFGARGKDIAYTLNPVDGQGLTASIRDGSPLHQSVLGGVFGIMMDLKRAWMSMGYFTQPGESSHTLPSNGNSGSLLLQVVVAPTKSLSLGLTVLEPNIFRDAPGDDTPRSSHLQLLSQGIALGSPEGSSAANKGLSSESSSLDRNFSQYRRQLGAMFALDCIGGLAFHGWATTPEDSISAGIYDEVQWGLSAFPRPDGSDSGWALGIGRCSKIGSTSRTQMTGVLKSMDPNMLEVSSHFNMGDGILVSPGVVLLRQEGNAAVFAGLRSTWMF